MASSPQGPGWWQASDGAWYAPEQHPNYQPPAASPTAPPIAPSAAPSAYGAPSSSPYGQPLYGQPAYGQPLYGQPAYGQPPYGQPAYGQPTQPTTPPYLGATQGSPPYGMPPAVPTPAPQRRGRTATAVAIVIVVLMLGAAAGVYFVTKATERAFTGTSVETTNNVGVSSKKSAPDATGKVDIIGASSGKENDVVAAAIVDIESFWKKTFPTVYSGSYAPPAGGYYSWSPGEQLPPCVESEKFIRGNAFYCGTEDVLAWDDTDLIPHLYETYGDLSVAIVLAHELGHSVQGQSGMRGATVTLEQQADCFAGAWVAHVQDGKSDYFTADPVALDKAAGALLEIGDVPGTSASDPGAHGSAFDRISSFQDGMEGGAERCSTYSNATVGKRLTELEFQSTEDYNNNGNLPYKEIMDITTQDLEGFWATVAKSDYSTEWKPLKDAKPFTGSAPKCGSEDTSGYSLFYCANDQFVAYDQKLFTDVYGQLGDFAVSTLFGSQYALAAEDQFDVTPDTSKEQNLMADCMTGAWAGSVLTGDRGQDAKLSLSPGDLDEAVKVLLAFGAKDDKSDQASGFDRVKAFRNGVVNGVTFCTK